MQEPSDFVEGERRWAAVLFADMASFTSASEAQGISQDGIRTEVDGLRGEAISGASHSWAVEGGTSKMPARPFAQPAAEKSRTRFSGRVSEAVRGELPK